MANQDADTIKYFKQLKEYIREYKLANVAGDVSLNWKDALAKEKNDSLSSEFDRPDYATTYSIQNNAYDLEKLKADASSNNLNESFYSISFTRSLY